MMATNQMMITTTNNMTVTSLKFTTICSLQIHALSDEGNCAWHIEAPLLGIIKDHPPVGLMP